MIDSESDWKRELKFELGRAERRWHLKNELAFINGDWFVPLEKLVRDIRLTWVVEFIVDGGPMRYGLIETIGTGLILFKPYLTSTDRHTFINFKLSEIKAMRVKFLRGEK